MMVLSSILIAAPATGVVAAQLNPCIPPGPGNIVNAPTTEPTATEFDIVLPPTTEPTATEFDIVAPPTATATLDIRIVFDSAGTGDQLAFAQIDDDKTSRPTEIPNCGDDDVTPTTETECERCEPVVTPDSCNDSGIVLYPDDPTATIEPSATATTEATATATTEPTATATLEPTATETPELIPQGAETGSKLAFAQSDDACETVTPPGDDPGKPGVTGLPSTGTGESGSMQASWMVLTLLTGLVLFSVGLLSIRKNATRR
jgi:type VI secretion system secreted protein VgrG